ncbi:MAG: Alkaline phosphatase [Parcubacteria group bacterium GW2011_GWA1_36_12]|nr:MAG: Alkaline phosphatase [Parcubacteria group bacterium GW2011_GWA1_36_12]
MIPQDLLTFFDNFSVTFLFFLVLLVEAGIPIPIPYDILILAAGYRQINFWHILVAVVLGNLIGSTILYSLFLKFSHPLLFKSSKFLGLSQKRINLIESWFDKWGGAAIILARLIPGLRFAATVFAGIFSLPYFKVFLPYLFFGSILWVSLYWVFGRVFGQSIQLLIQVLGLWSALLTIVLVLFLIIIIAGIFKKKYDRRSANN